jgi:hypothetical protein
LSGQIKAISSDLILNETAIDSPKKTSLPEVMKRKPGSVPLVEVRDDGKFPWTRFDLTDVDDDSKSLDPRILNSISLHMLTRQLESALLRP